MGVKMIEIEGPWEKGFAFDIHTISSVCTGNNQSGYPTFDTKYSEMGEEVYNLKYRNDVNRLTKIIELLSIDNELADFMKNIDVILPVPPSNKTRPIQPVITVALKLSEIFKKEIYTSILNSTNNKQVKSIETSEKYDTVKKSISINDTILDKSKKILIFDDLFDSGSTLIAYTNALVEKGYQNISILTLTKTRKSD